jgi:hypothetical protein
MTFQSIGAARLNGNPFGDLRPLLLQWQRISRTMRFNIRMPSLDRSHCGGSAPDGLSHPLA